MGRKDKALGIIAKEVMQEPPLPTGERHHAAAWRKLLSVDGLGTISADMDALTRMRDA